MLVVGDNCAPETEAVVRSMDDSRFSYLNLQRRFGHQSGPNSVGGLVASTPLLAYLNHDDILLPDHIARARAKLSAGSDFFVGAALYAEGTSREAMDSAGAALYTNIAALTGSTTTFAIATTICLSPPAPGFSTVALSSE